jgi:hypothetical protein
LRLFATESWTDRVTAGVAYDVHSWLIDPRINFRGGAYALCAVIIGDAGTPVSYPAAYLSARAPQPANVRSEELITVLKLDDKPFVEAFARIVQAANELNEAIAKITLADAH